MIWGSLIILDNVADTILACFLQVDLAGEGAETAPVRGKKILLQTQRGRTEAYVTMEKKVLCIH